MVIEIIKQLIAANRFVGVNSFLSFNTIVFIWGNFFIKIPLIPKKLKYHRSGNDITDE